MKRIIVILTCLMAMMNIVATEVSVTLVSRTSASVMVDGDAAGEETAGGVIAEGITTEVTTTATTGSIGQMTSGNKLVLKVAGIPKGTVSKLQLTMHSNSTSGKGSMTMKIADQTVWSISNKNFKDWVSGGKYTTSPTTFGKSGTWDIEPTDTIGLSIQATENSLYFDGLTISYTEAPKEAHAVTLQWYDETGAMQTTVLTESAPENGVVLPSYDIEIDDGEKVWQLVGWAKEYLPEMAVEPDYEYGGTTYYPEENTTLYGLYKYQEPKKTIVQDTTYSSGEYMIVKPFGNKYLMASGGVASDGYVATHECQVQKNGEGLYTYVTDAVAKQYRYVLTRRNDSVQLKSVQSGGYIGYDNLSKNRLAVKPSWWKIRKQQNKSFVMSHDYKASDNSERVFSVAMDLDSEEDIYRFIDYNPVTYSETYEGLILFNVVNVPTTAQSTKWTCDVAVYTDVEEVGADGRTRARKEMIDGRIIIRLPDGKYTITGQKVR